LPDNYARGRIIGDYRRLALYGTEKLIEEKKADFLAIDGDMSDEKVRLREEISSQIQALKDMGYIIGYIAPNPDAERETGGVIVMPDVMSVNDSIDKIHTVSEFGSYNGEE
jgi:hypothetical protein